jgi:hypothetical protein
MQLLQPTGIRLVYEMPAKDFSLLAKLAEMLDETR